MIWEMMLEATLAVGRAFSWAGRLVVPDATWDVMEAAIVDWGVGLIVVLHAMLTVPARAAVGTALAVAFGVFVLWSVLRIVKMVRSWLP